MRKKLKQRIHLWIIDKMIQSVDRELDLCDSDDELVDIHTALSLYYCRIYRRFDAKAT